MRRSMSCSSARGRQSLCASSDATATKCERSLLLPPPRCCAASQCVISLAGQALTGCHAPPRPFPGCNLAAHAMVLEQIDAAGADRAEPATVCCAGACQMSSR